MKVRNLTHEDYDEILVKWWNDWRWVAPVRDFLPEDGKGGFIVYDEDTPVCAGYMYITNSKAGWCDFVVSNFNYKNKEKRKKALELLIDTINVVLKNVGCVYSYTVLKNKSLINTYEKLGYKKGSINCSEMIKIL
jgi:hypothetical protein